MSDGAANTIGRSAAFGAGCGLLGWAFVRASGEAAAEATMGAGAGGVLVPALLAAVSFFALFFSVFVLRRGPRNLVVVAAAAVLALLVPYLFSTTGAAPTLYPLPDRDRLTWWPANATEKERSPRLPAVSYVSNAEGFRGELPGPRSPDSLRFQVIGDSFVFGMGLEPKDTLPVQLEGVLRARHPGRAIEVVNLGVPGNNLLGHVQLFEKVGDRFHADATVLCITENDLANWTPQGLQPKEYQLGLFSVVSFLAGPNAARLAWAGLYALPDGSPEERAAAKELLERAAAQAERDQKPLIVYAFPAAYADLVATIAGRPFVAAAASRAEEVRLSFFFEHDGHPTAEGDAYFARRIAELAESLPQLSPRLATPNP